jgi:thymidylate synthase (FAD)
MNSCKIIAVTEPIQIEGCKDANDLIAYVARVSNPSNQTNSETASKLIKYLHKNKHWSPFELVNAVMEVTTTRDIARQILRHRSFSFQEFSQRYADPTSDLGFVTREARLQDVKNRQNSIEIEDDPELKYEWVQRQEALLDGVKRHYSWAVANGIAKEQARSILPEGLTVSRLYMSGSIRSWIHYCQLRMESGTQKEHRDVATSAWHQLTNKFPSLIDIMHD